MSIHKRHKARVEPLVRQLRVVLKPIAGKLRYEEISEGNAVLLVHGLGLYPCILVTRGERTKWGWPRLGFPEPGQPWGVALYRDYLHYPAAPEVDKVPATEAEVVAFVIEHLSDIDPFDARSGSELNCVVCGLPRPCPCGGGKEA